MTYEQWQELVPEEVRGDSLWNLKAYRLALFLADLAWHDAGKLLREKRTCDAADQLWRAAGKISAHMAEGYSRRTGKERSRYYEYALGSSRESRDWYYKSRHVLGDRVTRHRLDLTTQLIRLTMTMTRNERAANRSL
jgi:four helix bundle protein